VQREHVLAQQVAAVDVAAAFVVAGALVGSRLAGPHNAGAIAAFPAVTATLAGAVAARNGRLAGASALAGLIRSLPCYLTFCLVVSFAAPRVGLPGVGLALP
jgi:hypothetical protein